MTFATEYPAEYTFLCDYNESVEQGARYNNFYSSLYRTMNKYDNLSDKQLSALQSSIARAATYAADRELQALTAEPISAHLNLIEGKCKGVIVTGEVLSVRLKWSRYGEVLKMRVRDDRGFTVWGSVPASIATVEQGERVTFAAATVTVSDNDPTFGFFNRPQQGRILPAEVSAE